MRRIQQETCRTMLLGADGPGREARIRIAMTAGTTVLWRHRIRSCAHQLSRMRTLMTSRTSLQRRHLASPSDGMLRVAVTTGAIGCRVHTAQREAQLTMLRDGWSRALPHIRTMATRTVVRLGKPQRCVCNRCWRLARTTKRSTNLGAPIVRVLMALRTRANGQSFAFFRRHRATGAFRVTSGTRHLAVGAGEFEASMREARSQREGLLLTMTASAVRAKGANVHVLMATRALLREPQETAAGRGIAIIRVLVTAYTAQLDVHASQFELHMAVVIGMRIRDPEPFECVRWQQRGAVPVMLGMAHLALRFGQGRVYAGLGNSLIANGGMACNTCLRRHRPIAVTGCAIRSALQFGHCRVCRMQRSGACIGARQVPPSEGDDRQQRDQRDNPARDLHLESPPRMTPKSTLPKRTA
jgi:hypothetical protein